MQSTVVVSQIGAHMHYAVPRILADHGRLEHLYADLCATPGFLQAFDRVPQRWQPRFIRACTEQGPLGIAAARVTTFPRIAILAALRRVMSRSQTQRTRLSLRQAQAVSEQVLRQGFSGARMVYGFGGECLELVREARASGLWTVIHQINVPRAIHDRLLVEEYERFQDWEPRRDADHAAALYFQREQQEWASADLILCGSDFVRDSVVESGGNADVCEVLPYGAGGRFAGVERKDRSGPLRVLTVGDISLRKGSPYVLEAARQFTGRAEFRMVGRCDVPANIRERLAQTLQLAGQVSRSQILAHYAWADVFLLPSICEGSAMAVYEALGAGLPVITTTNAGSVVRDGQEGFIVPIRNTSVIVNALELLDGDRSLLAAMGENARKRGEEFSALTYAKRLIAALDRCMHETAGAAGQRIAD